VKIGIDARQISHRKRHGMRTYVENLVLALSKIDRKNEYVLYLDAKDPFVLDRLGPNFSIRILPWLIPRFSSLWNDYFFLPRAVKRDKIDLMHFPANPVNIWHKTRGVFTVHDAIPFFSKRTPVSKQGIFAALYGRYNAYLIDKAADKAAALITISQASQRDLLKFSRLPKSNLNIIYLAAKTDLKPVQDEEKLAAIKEKFGLGARFLLGFEHKNGGRIIKAFGRLSDHIKHTYKVGLISQSGKFSDGLQRIICAENLSDKIVLIPPVSEPDLILLYNAADLFIFPSFYEGFGLPVVEAMQCGCPVICSVRGSLPEVAGDAAEFIKELDNSDRCAAELAHKIEAICREESLRNRLIQAGLAQAEKFSWLKTARETLNVYKSVSQS